MPSVIEGEIKNTSDYSVTLTENDRIPILVDGKLLKKVAPSSLSGGGGGNTIYSADDSLTGDRTVDLDGNFLKFNSGGNTYFSVDTATQAYSLGNGNTGFGLFIDEAGLTASLSDGNITMSIDGGFFKLSLSGVPNYADNAAAITGGLTAGNIYRTSAGGTSTLKIVE